MTLGFKQHIAGAPTWFAEKIIFGLPLTYESQRMTLMDSMAEVVEPNSFEFDIGSCNPLINHRPKLHTIREDKKNLWAAGKLIHPVINNRTANRFQFAPTMPCVSTQTFDLKWDNWGTCIIKVDGRVIATEEGKQLALNDGFGSLEDFLRYFDKSFIGKIIHWTDLKY